MQKLGADKSAGESKAITMRITKEQEKWLNSKGQKSHIIRQLIDKEMKRRKS